MIHLSMRCIMHENVTDTQRVYVHMGMTIVNFVLLMCTWHHLHTNQYMLVKYITRMYDSTRKTIQRSVYILIITTCVYIKPFTRMLHVVQFNHMGIPA